MITKFNKFSFFEPLKPELVKAAQKVYDNWDQNDEGYCDSYGCGGICHDIASAMCDVLWKYDVECTTVSSNFEQHVYVVAKTSEGVFNIDISPYTYETGGGFCWRKIPDVEFDNYDIIINKLSNSPEDYETFTDYER